MQTLVVGCSFVDNLKRSDSPNQRIDHDLFQLSAQSGSGNQCIAARILWENSRESFKEVIVLWSGINRLDFPIGIPLHDTVNGDRRTSFFTVLDQTVWYHSGGFGSLNHAPDWFNKWCQAQYKSSTSRYLTDLTLISIISAQSFLESKKIPYRMSWIYDVDSNDYNEHMLGKIDRTSRFIDQVDWDKFIKFPTPFEYARTHNQLLADGFHPKWQCMIDWFRDSMKLDLMYH